MTHDDDRPRPASSDDDSEESRSPKKERVLHTRVPAVLEQELKQLATNLRVPVSNVVRAILEDAMEAVDAVGQRAEGELKGIAERLAHQRDTLKSAARGAAPEPKRRAAESTCPKESASLEGILGFQELVLASGATCAGCGKELPRGSVAHRGVRDQPGSGPTFLFGRDCSLLPMSGAAKESQS